MGLPPRKAQRPRTNVLVHHKLSAARFEIQDVAISAPPLLAIIILVGDGFSATDPRGDDVGRDRLRIGGGLTILWHAVITEQKYALDMGVRFHVQVSSVTDFDYGFGLFRGHFGQVFVVMGCLNHVVSCRP